MPRIQFIELHEQPGCPSFLRDEITDALQFGLNSLKTYAPITPLLQSALDSTHSRSIIDMCSGAAGPWLDLSQRLHADAQASFRILLTDKYPNIGAFEKIKEASGNQIDFNPGPIDAMNVPVELKGFRTMFTTFHHFSPDEARAVLQNAVDAGQGIGIFEVTRRAPATIGLIFLWSLMSLAFTPWIRPFRWSRLVCTYVLPLIPFVLLFDGLVSCLRAYRPQELREIVATLNATGYEWRIGVHFKARGDLPITYLIGCPQAPISVS
ncbi:MAG: hypothetical protein WAK91_16210 [Candidatus Acidiferrales bacterium]|jgi:hypothetical protein